MYLYMFTVLVFILNLVSIFINNWLMIWILMELNLMIFIPLIIEKKNIKSMSKISFKYFLIQSFSSMFFFFSILMNFMLKNLVNMNLIYLLMMMVMFIKLGMFPFHMWFVKMMNVISWSNCFILSTIQKMIPFIILMNFINKNLLIFLIMNIFNTIMSTIGGLNQNFIKPLMSYSSINHMSWMMLIKLTLEKMFYIYMLIYLLTNFMIMKMMDMMNMKFINKIFNSKLNFFMKMIIMINVLSLGGIPPMIGFMIKWMSIFSIKYNMILILNIIILLLTSTVTMIYYLYMLIPSLMYYNLKFKQKNYKYNFKDIKFMPIMIMFLTFSTLMFNNILY